MQFVKKQNQIFALFLQQLTHDWPPERAGNFKSILLHPYNNTLSHELEVNLTLEVTIYELIITIYSALVKKYHKTTFFVNKNVDF